MPALASIALYLSRLSASLRGALWMVLACACFAVLVAVIKHLSGVLHPFELVFFRNLFGLLFVLPVLWRVGPGSLGTRRLPMHGLRALLGVGGMLTWFTVVSMMPLAEITALSFTAPLFATIGAAFILGETVRAHRWTAIVVGFAGAMIILRPGVESLSTATFLVLASAAFMAASTLVIKSLSRTESAPSVVLYMTLMLAPLTLVPALFVWTAPPLTSWVWLASMGLFGTAGHMALVRSLATADASAVLPFDFSRIVFAALLGFLFFGEKPDIWTWVGSCVIFAATLYIAHRERRAEKYSEPISGAEGSPPAQPPLL